jgi:hypothetical protein
MLAVFRHPLALDAATLAILINVGVVGSGLASGLNDDPRTAEGWAWSKIQQGELVDLNENCGTPRIDPNDEQDTRWQENCRKLSARFLQDLLTRAPWRESIPLGGIGIKGAIFDGNIDLSDVQLIRSLVVIDSRVKGQIDLSNARTNSRISLDHFVMDDAFIAENLHSESQLDLQNGVFKKEVNLAGAKIDGSINLSGSRLEAPLIADTLEVGGSLHMESTSFKTVNLMAAKIGGYVGTSGSSFEEPFNASFARIGGSLVMASDPQHTTKFTTVNLVGTKITENAFLNNTTFDGDFDAGYLQVGGTLSMIGSSIYGAFNANYLNIDGDLLLNEAHLKEANLNAAKVKGSFNANGSSLDGAFNANTLQVDGDFIIGLDNNNNLSSFSNIFINNSKINGNFRIIYANIRGNLLAGMLRVGGNLEMESVTEDFKDDVTKIAGEFDVALPQKYVHKKAKFKHIMLVGASVEGHVLIAGSVFDGEFLASYLRIGGSMYMRDAQYLAEVSLNMAHVGGNLDLSGAILAAGFDLSGASIGGDLQLGGGNKSAVWQGDKAVLYLHNAHVANLVDAVNAWPGPGRLHLDGFPFSHLGGSNGATGQDMRKRGADWWDNWARRDDQYNPTTYAQLAEVFASGGDYDGANDIRYLSREREREIACKERLLGSCLLQSALGYVAGYGIGHHTFIVLAWVFGFWFASAALLWWTAPAARDRGTVWCICASLAQLLPVLQINKELTDFFNDPERVRLKGWQVFFFSTLGIIGFALGTILVVAVSGLTHSA